MGPFIGAGWVHTSSAVTSEEIAEGLDSDDGARDGIIFWNRILDKDLFGQRFQNSPPRSGNNRIIGDSVGDRQRQEGTRSLSSENIMPP